MTDEHILGQEKEKVLIQVIQKEDGSIGVRGPSFIIHNPIQFVDVVSSVMRLLVPTWVKQQVETESKIQVPNMVPPVGLDLQKPPRNK